jgi:autotransporter-associated beta strand protein
VPNSTSDTATFASSNVTSVSLSNGVEVNGIVFNAGASAFTINVSRPVQQFQLFITGAGITNNSGIAQHFVTGDDAGGAIGEIIFTNNAMAGSMTVFTNRGGVFGGATGGGGGMFFTDNSNADHATFVNKPGAVTGAGGGFVYLQVGASAGDATFTNEGAAVSDAGAGEVRFFEGSSAGNATIVNNGGTVNGAHGGTTIIYGGTSGAFTTSAADATLIANGGTNGGLGGLIDFQGRTRTGGKARVELFGDGTMRIDGHHAPGVTVGSIEGDGVIILGSNKLTVGTNNLNTVFSGKIKDGPNAVGGSLTKTGRRPLTLTGANTYTGGTLVKRGGLKVNNATGSGTGSGPLQVNVGILDGGGTIAGPVTIGTATAGGGAELIPVAGPDTPSTLTIKSALSFEGYAHYVVLLEGSGTNPRASKVTADGATIDSTAHFQLLAHISGSPATGSVFTIINNTSANPIAGTFSELPDGGILTAYPGLSFKANYEGGDGNDLTLTVQ